MRRSVRIPIALAALLAGAACSTTQHVQPGEGAPVASAQASADAASACASSCVGPASQRDCNGTVQPCNAGSTCVEGVCASAAIAKERLLADDAFDPASLGSLSREGYLNAWAVRAPLNAPRGEAVIAALEAGVMIDEPDKLPPATALCDRSGFVSPFRSTPGASMTRALLTSVIVTGHAQRVELWASVAGKATIVVNGKRALSLDGDADPAPLPDEARATVDLPAGASSIAVLLDQASQAPSGLYLRLRAPGHAPLSDILFAPGPVRGRACSPHDLADIALRPTPIEGGFAVAIESVFRGLSPRVANELPVAITLLGDKAAPPLSVAPLSVEAMRAGAVTRELTVKPAKQGSYSLRVSLGDSDAPRELAITYRGDLHERVLSAAKRALAAPLDKLTEGSRASLEKQAAWLTTALAAMDPDLPFLEDKSAELVSLAAKAEKGEDPYENKTGVVWRAYRSRLDGSLQPYLAFVPKRPKKGGSPLVLAMHGLNGESGQALRTVVGEAPERDNMNSPWAARHVPPLPNLGAIVAAPSGYGNSGTRLPGEDDAMRVLEEMKAAYPVIDPRRVSMTGYSLGGTVSFAVPLHHPGVFAAAAPLCGYPNLADWQGVRDVQHAPWEDTMIARRAVLPYVENGLLLALHIVHGGQDRPDRSALIADRYRALGYPRLFDVQDDLDHDVWDYAYKKGRMIGWLRYRQLPEVPRKIRLYTGEQRYDEAAYAMLIFVKDVEKRAALDVEVTPGEQIAIATENVDAFAIDVPKAGEQHEVALVVDGTTVCRAAEKRYLSRAADTWSCSPNAPETAGKKAARLAGPLDDIQLHPTLVVYGTLRNAEVNRLVAEKHATVEQSNLKYPIVADADLTESDLTTKSLILIGGPGDNRVTAKLADALPVKFAQGAAGPSITLRDKHFEGADTGVSFIYPSPKAKGEYVVVHAGLGPMGTLASRFLPSFTPDFIVYDGAMTAQRKGLLLGKRKAIWGGFFDTNWK